MYLWNFEEVSLVCEEPMTLLRRQENYLKGNDLTWVTPKLHSQGQVSVGWLSLGQVL